eukprot:3976608-Ditylum_brightwellii.AAC.1
MLAGTKHTKRHNRICQYLHWCILQGYNIAVNPNWKKHKPKSVKLITNQLLMTYNMTQEVDKAVVANRPDIVVLNKKEHKALIINVTVPMDINMIKAAAVGALGMICQNLDSLLAWVSPQVNLDLIKKEVLQGSAQIFAIH